MPTSILNATYNFFAQIWRLFNSWYLPGTNVTPAGMGFLILFGYVIARFISSILSLHHIPDINAPQKPSTELIDIHHRSE